MPVYLTHRQARKSALGYITLLLVPARDNSLPSTLASLFGGHLISPDATPKFAALPPHFDEVLKHLIRYFFLGHAPIIRDPLWQCKCFVLDVRKGVTYNVL